MNNGRAIWRKDIFSCIARYWIGNGIEIKTYPGYSSTAY